LQKAVGHGRDGVEKDDGPSVTVSVSHTTVLLAAPELLEAMEAA
jgi:hypothetical protein